jgi:flagellar biosynthetic protein FlhB
MAQGSGEKTEKATAKKRRDVRKKGDVHKSTDLCSAIMLFIMFLTLKVGFEGFFRSLKGISASMLSDRLIVEKAANVTTATLMSYYKDILLTVLPLVLPVMGIAMIASILVHVVQTGPLFVTEKLKPDFKRLNPIEGFKRLFSARTLVELVKSIIKVVILAYIIYTYARVAFREFAGYMYNNVWTAFAKALSTSFTMGIMIGLALIVFGALDVLYQWWKFEKDIRMTKQEVKEENKQLEGDPQIKGKIKQKQRRMSAQRMMKRIPEATVVVTNPEHFAVALRYRENQDRAPVVIAKGQDYLAQKIKKIAAEHGVAIVENKPVARALYWTCDIDDEIPAELYQAIADILIYVYKTIGKNL